MTINANYVEARRCTSLAREINDRYAKGKMPAEAAHQMSVLLDKAAEYRNRGQLVEAEAFMNEPVYKHDMYAGTAAYDQPQAHKAQRIGYVDDGPEPPMSRDTKNFLGYVRTGAYEHKAALVEDATGQNLIPRDYAGTIVAALARQAVLFPQVLRRPTTKQLVDVGAVVIGTPTWGTLETGATPPDGLGGTPASKQTITVYDLTALVKIGRNELNDSDENLAAIIQETLAIKFAEVVDDAVANGSGSGQPFGITHNVTNSVTAASNATVTGDDLKALQFKVSARFRRNGSYIASSDVHQAVALLKDTMGRYLLQPSTGAFEPDTLFGYPFLVVDGLPTMTTTGTATDPSCLFGDLRSAYMVADRQQLAVQRLEELYAPQGQLGLLFTLRLGGDTIRPNAMAKYLL